MLDDNDEFGRDWQVVAVHGFHSRKECEAAIPAYTAVHGGVWLVQHEVLFRKKILTSNWWSIEKKEVENADQAGHM